MTMTHSPLTREAGLALKSVSSPVRRTTETLLDPTVWQQILQTVRANHPSLHRVWFDQMTPRQLTNGVIQVTVSTPAQPEFLPGAMPAAFTASAQAVTGRLVAVSFHCENLPRGGVFNEGDQPLLLNPDYAFEQFVTAHAIGLRMRLVLQWGEQPGKAYNPLFVHGGVGLGKTHLLQAICQKVLEKQPTPAFFISPATRSLISSSRPLKPAT